MQLGSLLLGSNSAAIRFVQVTGNFFVEAFPRFHKNCLVNNK